MNRKNGSRDLATQTPGDNNYLRYGGNNEFIIARVIKDKVLQMHQHNLSLSSCIKMLSIIK